MVAIFRAPENGLEGDFGDTGISKLRPGRAVNLLLGTYVLLTGVNT